MVSPRILVVDDSETIRLSLRSYLEDAHYEIDDCASYAAALEAAATGRYDAAVVDYMLPTAPLSICWRSSRPPVSCSPSSSSPGTAPST